MVLVNPPREPVSGWSRRSEQRRLSSTRKLLPIKDRKEARTALPGSRDAIFEIFRAGNLPALADFNDSGSRSDIENAPPEELF